MKLLISDGSSEAVYINGLDQWSEFNLMSCLVLASLLVSPH